MINYEDTCIWFTNIQKSPINCQRFIVFDKMKYIVKDQVDPTFWNCFYISIDGI